MVALDIANTRIKDFYDIWSLSRAREFDGATLAAAILATFPRRTTTLPEDAPSALPTLSAKTRRSNGCGKRSCARAG